MEQYRDTYVLIDLDNIQYNVKRVISKYKDYQYYFGVVKADCYGHDGMNVVNSIISGGVNYLVVAIMEEALEIRKSFTDIPILCLGIIPINYLNIAYSNNITITINSYEYAKEVVQSGIKVKTHIKINSGMNRLGIKDIDEFKNTVSLLNDNNIFIEGIYTHIYNASNKCDTDSQFDKYELFIDSIDKKNIPILHVSASDALTMYEKKPYVNGCRLGIIMYGLNEDNSLGLKSTFSLYSKVIQINTLHKGESVGYNGAYVAKEDNEKIAVVCIGYADGIIRKNSGRCVYINDKSYNIVGNICMDMMFVKVDDSVKVFDTVIVLRDNNHINQVASHLDTISYEILCTISKRVPRIYKSLKQ